MNNSLTSNEQFKFSNVGLTTQGQPTFEEWQAAGDYLLYVESAIQWWIGDWLNYGESRWGEMYTQALSDTNYQEGTLRNLKSIAGKIEISRRNDKITFSHHVEGASLEPNQQNELLELAANEALTVRELRQRVKAIKMRNGDTGTDEYQRMTNQAINIIAILAENYRDGLIEIETYLRSL